MFKFDINECQKKRNTTEQLHRPNILVPKCNKTLRLFGADKPISL